jgi:hypothetical protein
MSAKSRARSCSFWGECEGLAAELAAGLRCDDAAGREWDPEGMSGSVRRGHRSAAKAAAIVKRS